MAALIFLIRQSNKTLLTEPSPKKLHVGIFPPDIAIQILDKLHHTKVFKENTKFSTFCLDQFSNLDPPIKFIKNPKIYFFLSLFIFYNSFSMFNQ